MYYIRIKTNIMDTSLQRSNVAFTGEVCVVHSYTINKNFEYIIYIAWHEKNWSLRIVGLINAPMNVASYYYYFYFLHAPCDSSRVVTFV